MPAIHLARLFSPRVGSITSTFSHHWKIPLVCALLIPGVAVGGPATNVAPEVWARIGPQVERQMYAFDADGRASNREQCFQVAAESSGLAVSGDLRLRVTALNGEPLPEAAPLVRENRVEYPRGAVTEWFENRKDGVEQGFTVKEFQIPSSSFQVDLDVALDGVRAMEIAADGQSARLTDTQGRDFGYGGLKAWDAVGRDLKVWLAQSQIANQQLQIQICVDTRGAQFPITIDPILTSMEAKLTASDGTNYAKFGCSVSVAGDAALVGAYSDSPDSVSGAGAAYIYERNAGGTNAWGEVAKLTASDKAMTDIFGVSVSIAGNVAVVGACWADRDGAADAGAAYVFERNASGTNAWGQVAKLTAADGMADDYFGGSVSVAGDVVLIGAGRAGPDGVPRAGAAYVFERHAGGTNAWGQIARLTAADKTTMDIFGCSVSVAGDVAVVGASYAASDGVTNAGAAYVFERNVGGTNAWGQVAKLSAADKAENDGFGISVSVVGDVVLVGAYQADPGGVTNAGAAYVFERNAGGTNAWGQVAKLTASDKTMNDSLGISVSVVGDMALVGSGWADPDGVTNAGAAYVFERNAGGTNAWGQVAKLTAFDKRTGDGFGYSVSVDGGVALIGAIDAAPSGMSSVGAAYIVPFNREDWREKSMLTASDRTNYDIFGCSVSVAGDVALVGACWAGPDGVTHAGAAYVYERDAGGTNVWGEVTKLTASDKAEVDCFGVSVNVASDVALIGAWWADPDGVTNAGAAYVFERNAGGTNAWGQVAKLTAADGMADDYFGGSVSLAGDVVLIGAGRAGPDGVPRAGAAYVFERHAGGTNAWGQIARLTAADKTTMDIFGCSVSVAGDVAVVGASYAASDGVTNAGAAYVFERNVGGTNAWGQVAKLTAADKAENDRFGASVSVAGDVALIGAWWADPKGAADAGAAYVFERNAGGTNAWGQVAKLTAADGTADDYFGASVSVDGDVALVGASCVDPDGVTNAGATYVFERNAGGVNAWGEVAKLTSSDKAKDGGFGASVSVDGGVALIGAGEASPSGMSGVGAAYVYESTLHGPPTITGATREAGVSELSFDCQPAWRYDVLCGTSLMTDDWLPVSTLIDLPGDVSGALTVRHTNETSSAFYRLRRHAP